MLIWNSITSNNCITHTTNTTATENINLKISVEACAEKAISLLNDNIQDDSLYLLFEWDAHSSTLNTVVTDASKKNDAPQRVRCEFLRLQQELSKLSEMEYEEQCVDKSEWIKFWLHDYLTTCTSFFKFSLVAIFHSSSRDNTELL